MADPIDPWAQYPDAKPAKPSGDDPWASFPDAGRPSPHASPGHFATRPEPSQPSQPAAWYERWLQGLINSHDSLDDRLRKGAAGHYGNKPILPVEPVSQEEADRAKAARGDQSLLAGYARQMGQGLFGLGDEAEAFGRRLWGEDYDKAVAEIRDKNHQFEHAHPGAATSGRLAGAAALSVLPVGGALEGATSLGNMALRSGLLGAGFSAAQGFGEGDGDLTKRLESAAKGVRHYATDPVSLGLSVGIPTAAYGIAQTANAVRSGAGPMSDLVRRNAEVAAERLADKINTVEAADRLGVRANPSMVMDHTGNTVYRVGTNIPVVGKPALNAIVDTYDTARAAGEDVARGLTRADTVAQGGRSLQEGLDTYRSAGIQRVDPDALRAIGIDPERPVPPPVQMSDPARRRAAQADAIRQEAGLDSPPPLQRPADMRRGAADLSDAELGRVINARDLPFASRAEALYERWWRSVPDMTRIDGSVNPNRVGVTNTRQAMTAIQGEVANQIAGQGRIAGDLAERLMNPSAHFSLNDLRGIRTEVGRALSNFGVMDQRLDRAQLNQIYGALSRDIEVGVQDLANRALINSRLPASDPRHVDPNVARQAQDSLRNLRRADQFWAAGMSRMDNFAKVLGAETPEVAMQRLTQAATEGTRGNQGLIRSAMAALSPEQRNDVAGVMLREMWRPNPSAKGYVAETGYSPSTFTTNWKRMSPEARQQIFGGIDGMPQAIDDFARVSNSLSEFEATVNHSNSGSHLITALIGGNIVGSLVGAAKTAGLGVAGYAGMYAWNSPQAVNLMTNYLRLRLNIARRLAQGEDPANAGRALQHFGRQVLNTAESSVPYAPTASVIYSDLSRLQREVDTERDQRSATRH